MTDTLARQRTLIGTTAQWALNDLIIGDGELALERTTTGKIKIKVGNGTLTYSALAFVGSDWGATAWSSPTRVLDTAYQNTNAWVISVLAYGVTTGLGAQFILSTSATVGGTYEWVGGSQSSETGSYEHFITGLIPPGWFYKVTTPSASSPALHGWRELA